MIIKRSRASLPRCSTVLALVTLMTLSGCVVVRVVDTAASITVDAVGLAADAAVGSAKIAGKAVGKAADAVVGDDKPAEAAKPVAEPKR